MEPSRVWWMDGYENSSRPGRLRSAGTGAAPGGSSPVSKSRIALHVSPPSFDSATESGFRGPALGLPSVTTDPTLLNARTMSPFESAAAWMEALLLGNRVLCGAAHVFPSPEVLRKMLSANRLRKKATYLPFFRGTTLGCTYPFDSGIRESCQ